MEVILIRHGIAENPSINKSDDKRALTDLGVQQLNQIFPLLKTKLLPNTMRRVWSSPLKRAQQTAALCCDHLKIAQFETYPFVAFGQTMDFKNAIYGQDVRSQIIIVGHEPTLSYWTTSLTQQPIMFNRGMIVCIEVDDKAPRNGNIKWIIDPKRELD